MPPTFRQIDQSTSQDAEKLNGKHKKGKVQQKNVSLMELNEKAHERIEEIRRANALKSQQKIKQLTAEH